MMALISKKKTPSSAPKSRIVQVNPYENPDNVMELMSKISSAPAHDHYREYWDKLMQQGVEKQSVSFVEYLKQQKGTFADPNFIEKFQALSQRFLSSLSAHENSYHTQIVVAGGFSSGKSSFLNRITGSTGLLPTGVEPVSVVKTYLYCSQHTHNISVRGVNLRNVLVELHPGVLQAIQHAKQSNVYLASVLDKLFVEIPSKDMDGLVFIDTPGYNNSDRANDSNGKTDRATALEALGEGDVLFWIVDSERGALVAEDIEMMKQFEGKKLIIFNKADKKGEKEMAQVLQSAADVLFQVFPQREIIDIIAFSTLENKLYGSHHNKTLSQIFTEVKQTRDSYDALKTIGKAVEKLFDYEIFVYNSRLRSQKLNWKQSVQAKEHYYSMGNAVKTGGLEEQRKLRFVLENNTGIGESIKKLSDYALWLIRDCSTLGVNHELSSFFYYMLEVWTRFGFSGKEIADEAEQKMVEFLNRQYKTEAQKTNQLLTMVENTEASIKSMENYRELIVSGLEYLQELKRKSKARVMNDSSTDDIPNVFDCIARNDYKAFLRSFEKGVDLSVCNPDGYSPLTLAVKQGHNMMVQFMLDHDADPTVQDRRGYNAFHTAVECQYRHLCQMLLDVDPDLLDSRTAQGETVAQLAQRQSFAQWMEQEIDNAY